MKRFFLILILALFIAPFVVFAVPCPAKDANGNPGPDNGLNLCYPTFGGFTLQLSTDLPHLIAWFYYAIVGLSGFAAFIMIVWDGIKLLGLSATNPGQMLEARRGIQNTLMGLLLVLSSFLILQIINPDFTMLKTP